MNNEKSIQINQEGHHKFLSFKKKLIYYILGLILLIVFLIAILKLISYLKKQTLENNLVGEKFHDIIKSYNNMLSNIKKSKQNKENPEKIKELVHIFFVQLNKELEKDIAICLQN